MKTYILRDPKAVEPQNPTRRDPALNPRTNATCGPAAPPLPVSSGSVLYVGLDVHNETIAASLAPGQSTEVRRYGIIGGSHDDVLRLIKKLSAAHPGLALKFCYEAGLARNFGGRDHDTFRAVAADKPAERITARPGS